MKILLASRSPQRRELLEHMHIDFDVVDIAINEDWDNTETPQQYVKRITMEKANAGYNTSCGVLPVLAADTCVIVDNEILGKAETNEQALQMLQKLSGRCHEVITAVALHYQSQHILLNHNRVYFRTLTAKEIHDYLALNESLGKAGGYAIQGFAARFICRLEGSYSGVMGLPLYETSQLINSIYETAPQS